MPPKRKDRNIVSEESLEDFDASPPVQGPEALETFRVLDRGVYKEAKTCVVCQRPFTWRKKWERCWDEVTTCSDKCKRQRKVDARKPSPTQAQDEQHIAANEAPDGKRDRHQRVRTKKCELCGEQVELAYRCKYEKGATEWKFVCRDCWPKASGSSEYLEELWKTRGTMDMGEPNALGQNHDKNDGGPALPGNPFYVYGGTWKATTGETKGEIARRKKADGPDHASATIMGG